jgi:hypothetical protein
MADEAPAEQAVAQAVLKAQELASLATSAAFR